MTDPTQRFSSRVTNYVKYRPSYPAAIIDLLAAECGLTPDSIVADVGSGTGLLAELFLKAGNRVWALSPIAKCVKPANNCCAARGGNTSNIHVDFMIGSGQIDIDGLNADGSLDPVMRQGEWAFAV